MSHSRSSSIDTFVGRVNDLAEKTELKNYVSDPAVDISSTSFHKSFSQPLDTISKTYSSGTSKKHSLKRDLNPSSSAASVEDQTLSKKSGVYVFATGGFRSGNSQGGEEGKEVFLFDTVKEKWENCGKLGKARNHHCVVSLNGVLYFIGGCSPDKSKSGQMEAEKNCYRLEIKTWKWSKIAKMRSCRMYHGVAELDGRIYAIGGKNEKDRVLSSVEVYSPVSNKWDQAMPLETPTMGVGVCVHERKIYVVGGMVQDEDGNISTIKDVRCYDPARRKWMQNMRHLPSPRAFAAVTSYDGSLWVIGGTTQDSSDEQMTSVMDVIYCDQDEQRWTSTSPLPFARHFAETAVVGNNLYVLGGLTSYQQSAIDQVLLYNRKTSQWNFSTTMPVPLCGFAAATVPVSLT